MTHKPTAPRGAAASVSALTSSRAHTVGALRAISNAEGRLAEEADDGYRDTDISGLDDDYIETNEFRIRLATSEYLDGSEFDAERIWRDLREKPGLAVVNASMVPTRDSGVFQLQSDDFMLYDAADRIEAALISHAIKTIDISETV